MSVKIPHDDRLEQSVIGGILQDEKARNEVAEILKADDFHSARNVRLFETIMTLHFRQQQIDQLTVSEHKISRYDGDNKTLDQYLIECIEANPGPSYAAEHARIIREKAWRRKVITEANSLIRDASQEKEGIADVLTRYINNGSTRFAI